MISDEDRYHVPDRVHRAVKRLCDRYQWVNVSSGTGSLE